MPTRTRDLTRPLLRTRRATALLRAETALFLRDGPAAIFSVLTPALILVGAGLAIPGMRSTIEGGALDGLRLIQIYTPAVLTMALATPAISTLPTVVATYREHGVLRRLSTTPLRPTTVLAVQVVINLVAFLVAALLAIILATAVFDTPNPRHIPTALLSLIVGALALFGLGMVIAARAPTSAAASGISMLVYFPMLFLAGLWTPGPLMPELARQLATYTPVGAISQALSTAWFSDEFPLLQLVVLTTYAVGLSALAAWLFRWD